MGFNVNISLFEEEDIIEIIDSFVEKDRSYPSRSYFIREAVREKLDRMGLEIGTTQFKVIEESEAREILIDGNYVTPRTLCVLLDIPINHGNLSRAGIVLSKIGWKKRNPKENGGTWQRSHI